ncbi:MAG: hypothetical protein FJ279_26735 [Planctomycetes bacterium]|nr:hypothetical protein [Planctomycetota bacterium]
MQRVAAAVLAAFLLVAVLDDGRRASAEQPRAGQKARAQAEVKLAPPLKHWVFDLPPDRQARLVSVRVWVQDERGQPAPNALVMGYCEPWDYMSQVQSDAGGQALIRGPVGDWTFIFHYIHARYGQAVNRDYLHALHGSQGNLEKLVLSCPHLETAHDMVCAAYSCLATDNLAWLFRWSGFPVADPTITKAMKWFKEQGVRLPGEKE